MEEVSDRRYQFISEELARLCEREKKVLNIRNSLVKMLVTGWTVIVTALLFVFETWQSRVGALYPGISIVLFLGSAINLITFLRLTINISALDVLAPAPVLDTSNYD